MCFTLSIGFSIWKPHNENHITNVHNITSKLFGTASKALTDAVLQFSFLILYIIIYIPYSIHCRFTTFGGQIMRTVVNSLLLFYFIFFVFSRPLIYHYTLLLQQNTSRTKYMHYFFFSSKIIHSAKIWTVLIKYSIFKYLNSFT